MSKTTWFQVDTELWQEPGPLKLNWPTRKLAIYLRESAGAYSADSDEVQPHAVFRSLKRIVEETALSQSQVAKSLARLQSWPSRRKRFLKSYDLKQGIFILREVQTPWIRVYRWLWESDLPDDFKDMRLFTRTRFEGKDSEGRELFSLNRRGMKQKSVYRCCHIICHVPSYPPR